MASGRRAAEWHQQLLAACSAGDVKRVKMLVEGNSWGYDVNLPDSEGANALVHAVECGSLELVRFLAVEGGADVNYSDEQGFGAVTVAAYLGHTAIVKYLLSLPDHTMPPTQHTPLIAAASCSLETTKAIVECGRDINEQGVMGYTPVMMAALSNKPDVVAYLIEQGADVTIENEHDATVMEAIIAEPKMDAADKARMIKVVEEALRAREGGESDEDTLVPRQCKRMCSSWFTS